MSCQSRTTSDSKNNGERETDCTILKPNTKERTSYLREHLLYRDHSLKGFVQMFSAERCNYVPVIDAPRHTSNGMSLQRQGSLCSSVRGGSLQQWPGTPMTALSTGPAVHLQEHHTLNLFHQTRCSSGGVQCLYWWLPVLFTQCHLDPSLLPAEYLIWWHCWC